jgi:prolyl oligopeptidase
MLKRALVVVVSCWAAGGVGASEAEDPLMWLEEVTGQRALEWVEVQNSKSTKVLEAVPEFKPIYDRTLEILDSDERIPEPTLRGSTVYNLWQDKQHERGIWRRTSLASYRTETPEWETVIDVDALSQADDVPWVFKNAPCLPPAHRLCMVALSRGGGDAVVYREFDTETRSFVEGGFTLPEAKSFVSWRDENTLWLGTDFGEGSLTESGYPRQVRLWKRGTAFREAELVYECGPEDVLATGSSMFRPEGRYDLVTRIPAFFRSETFLLLGGRLVKLDLPEDAEIQEIFRDQLLVSLRSDWKLAGTTHPAGALLAIGLGDFLKRDRDFEVLFEPTERSSLQSVGTTRDRVVVSLLDNVKSKLLSFKFAEAGWKREGLSVPGLGTVSVNSASDELDVFLYTYEDFLTPPALYVLEEGSASKVKSMPAFFDAGGMIVTQHEATSADGTKIPYFLVMPEGFETDGSRPTLLYAYGGFEISMVPEYSPTLGAAWLARGGAYALANIRGGGEFGPKWHRAAMKENHIRNFEDFIAVADDLVARKISSPRHLGIMGGSQGGLLVGGTFTMRPDLFTAVVSQVPLADMKRYNKLLAGASWMAEYGNPDIPEEWAYIQKWSPYHLLQKDVAYPTPFFWTNTRDDRVHPAHARKMVAKMQELGHPVIYFENVEGGHGSGSVNTQKAYTSALQYAYLWKMLR